MVSDTVRFSVALSFSGAIHVIVALSAPFTANTQRLHSMPLAVTIDAAVSGEFRPLVPPSAFPHVMRRDNVRPEAQTVRARTLTEPLVFPVQSAPTETVAATVPPATFEMRTANASNVLQQNEAGDVGSKQDSLSTLTLTPGTSSTRSLPASRSGSSLLTLKERSSDLLPTSAVPSYSPPPEYPEEARWEKRTGRALLAFRLRPDGVPEDIRLMASSGHADLDAAARESLERWRFEVPKGVKKDSTWYKYAFRFELM